jgi:hypothetical protein
MPVSSCGTSPFISHAPGSTALPPLVTDRTVEGNASGASFMPTSRDNATDSAAQKALQNRLRPPNEASRFFRFCNPCIKDWRRGKNDGDAPTSPSSSAADRPELESQQAASAADPNSVHGASNLWDQLNPLVRKQLGGILGTSLSPDNSELAPALDRQIRGLSDFLQAIQRYRIADRPSDKALSLLDGEFLAHVTAMENHRNPKLQASAFDNLSSFVDHLQNRFEDYDNRLRRHRVRTGMEDETHHNITIDVIKKRGMLSLIALDPAGMWLREVKRAMNTLNTELLRLGHPYKWSYISLNLQSRNHDCTPLSGSITNKAADEEEFIGGLHDKQMEGEPLCIRPESDASEMYRGHESSAIESPHNLHEVVAQTHDFPWRFLKHAQEPSTIAEYLEARPEYADIKVNKEHPDKPAQTLPERQESHIPPDGRLKDPTKRESFANKKLYYSLSSEKRREKSVTATLEFFKDLRAALPAAVTG